MFQFCAFMIIITSNSDQIQDHLYKSMYKTKGIFCVEHYDLATWFNHFNTFFRPIFDVICYQLWKQNQCGNYLTTIQQNNEILHLFITSAILVNPMDVFSNICINTRKIRVCTSNAKWYNSNDIHFKCPIESDLKQNLSPFTVLKNLKVPKYFLP